MSYHDNWKSDWDLQRERRDLSDKWPYRSFLHEEASEERIREINRELERREERRREEEAGEWRCEQQRRERRAWEEELRDRAEQERQQWQEEQIPGARQERGGGPCRREPIIAEYHPGGPPRPHERAIGTMLDIPAAPDLSWLRRLITGDCAPQSGQPEGGAETTDSALRFRSVEAKMTIQNRDPISEIDASLQILGSILTVLIGITNADSSDRLFMAKHRINQARSELRGIDRVASSGDRAPWPVSHVCH